MSKPRVRKQVDLWKKYLPKIMPYYAVKSNPEYYLLEEMASSGFGFDCASAREIDLVRSFSTKILYANPCKKNSDIVYASKMGIHRTVVDSVEEVDKLCDTNWKGDSLVRIRVDDSQSKVPFSKKFGASLSEVSEIAKYSSEKGQQLSGISFHVGSGCGNSEQFARAIDTASLAISTLRQYGYNANIVDIGGGFTKETFIEDARHILSRRSHIQRDLEMIAEPGRFISETSHDLFVKVIGKKSMSNGRGYRYTIDESLYGQFSCIPFDCAKPRWLRVRGKDGPRQRMPGILYGRTCDSVDMIASASSMEELMVGDWLWFPHMGAYTSVTSSEFNGFPRPPVYLLEEYTAHLTLPEPDLKEAWPEKVNYVYPVKVCS